MNAVDDFDYFSDVREKTHQGTIIEIFKRVICFKQYTLGNLYVSIKAYINEVLPIEVAKSLLYEIRTEFIEYTNKYKDRDSVGLAKLMNKVNDLLKKRGIK